MDVVLIMLLQIYDQINMLNMELVSIIASTILSFGWFLVYIYLYCVSSLNCVIGFSLLFLGGLYFVWFYCV